METELVLELPNDLRTIEQAVDYVMDRCSSCRTYARRVQFNFRVGLTEALSNAMLYGNEQDPSKRVRVEVAVGEDAITARITDEGEGFDPESVHDPLAPENRLRPNGRGLFYMKRFMDEIDYSFEPGRGMEVTLKKRLASADGSTADGGSSDDSHDR